MRKKEEGVRDNAFLEFYLSHPDKRPPEFPNGIGISDSHLDPQLELFSKVISTLASFRELRQCCLVAKG